MYISMLLHTVLSIVVDDTNMEDMSVKACRPWVC